MKNKKKISRNILQNTRRRKHYIKKKLVYGLRILNHMSVIMIQTPNLHLQVAERSIHQTITTNHTSVQLKILFLKLKTQENTLNQE